MRREKRQQARLQHTSWQKGGRWVLFECACLLASQAAGAHDGPISVSLEYDQASETAVVNDGELYIARAEIEALARTRRQAGLGEHLPRAQRRSAEAQARGRTHGDLCEYCSGKGEQFIGRMMVVCDWCNGTGRRTACSLCHDTGEYVGNPCHSCPAGKERAAETAPVRPFRDPYEGQPGITAIDEKTLARMLRRAGMDR